MWQAGATLHHGARSPHCRVPLLLRSTGSRRAGSVVVAHGPSCSAACGIFPDQGLNPCPLHWQADSQPLRHQGSPIFIINNKNQPWPYQCLIKTKTLSSTCTMCLIFKAVTYSFSHSPALSLRRRFSGGVRCVYSVGTSGRGPARLVLLKHSAHWRGTAQKRPVPYFPLL